MLIGQIVGGIILAIIVGVLGVLDSDGYRERLYKIIAIILVILGIISLIIIKRNLFTIPKILLFISISLLAWSITKADFWSLSYGIGIIITVIAYIIAAVLYLGNIRKSETTDITVTKTSILCAKDNSVISGGMSGGIFYVQASVSEKSEYHYYYQQEDGGIKLGTIPADDTTIYYVGEDEGTYLETTVETTYTLNYNNNPATILDETSETTYKLYVPEGSVTSVYEFDAE